jgi:hypothetical protein
MWRVAGLIGVALILVGVCMLLQTAHILPGSLIGRGLPGGVMVHGQWSGIGWAAWAIAFGVGFLVWANGARTKT